MTNILFIFRRLLKSKYLRVVNLLGLSLIFASLLLSYAYVKRELSYDRFNTKADRIVRMSVNVNDDPDDGRVSWDKTIDQYLHTLPEIEAVIKFHVANTALLTCNGESQEVSDICFATDNFFKIFTIPLVQGDKERVLQPGNSVVLSERFARKLFGNNRAIGKEIQLTGRKVPNLTLFVSGVYKNIPENAHFHTDMVIHRDNDESDWPYYYLLLKRPSDAKTIGEKISKTMNHALSKYPNVKVHVHIMPLTDIHLHSHVLRELETNGNINYIYLIVGSNLFLIIIVLLNLWLNASLTFAANRKQYQLLRLNGASTFTVLRDEVVLAFVLGISAFVAGGIGAFYMSSLLHIQLDVLSSGRIMLLGICFVSAVVIISLLPVFSSMSSTLFLNEKTALRPERFSFSGIRYLLTAQYCIVILVVILALGIGKQVALIRNTQVAGNDSTTIVTKEQPEQVKARFALLKTELLKHPEIVSVTGAMQLPGSSIRDGIWVEVAENNKKESINLLVVGDDFFPFFNIKPLAGNLFASDKFSYQEHERMLLDKLEGKPLSDHPTEEYVLNKKAVAALGFKSEEEAIGKRLKIEHQCLAYINEGTVCGVVDNFTYTTLYEKAVPLIILQRSFFSSCFMIRLNPDNLPKALKTFNDVWHNVVPDFPPDYTFLKDEYGKVYHNELNAENLVCLFTLLCLLITNLGLLTFMSFIVKTRTKEIAIRRVNGATALEIVRMLNWNFIRWIALAFVIAVPVAYYVLQRWLENFAYKTSLSWWIFALAGISVLVLSVLLVSWQTWRAATANPVEALKGE